MREREPRKEIIGKGELFFLGHPQTEDTFSGYGLTQQPASKEFLVGLLMVDRPHPADPAWLQKVEDAFGSYQLVPMTATGERGIVCQMQVERGSLPFLRPFSGQKSFAIQEALKPLLNALPQPSFKVRWDAAAQLWRSEILSPNNLPPEIREVFEHSGYGCLAAETNVGVVHVCHAATDDIEAFKNKPVLYQWQLIKMPSAPLVRLEIAILDQADNPYFFESFLNVADESQLTVLGKLIGQEKLLLAFYGDSLSYSFTKEVVHNEQEWGQLESLVEQALQYLEKIPIGSLNFDRAKAEFIRLHQQLE